MNKPTTIHDSEVHKIFPKSKSLVNQKLKELNKELKEILARKKDIDREVYKDVGYSAILKAQQSLVFSARYGERVRTLEDDIERLTKLKKRYEYDPEKTSAVEIDLAAIKEIPITNFIQFNRGGKARCIWHDENTASLHYNEPRSKYPNTVKCFGCGVHASVIDVVMQQEGVDFKGAISILNQ